MRTPKAKTYYVAALANVVTDGDTDKLYELLADATANSDSPFERGREWATYPELVALRKYARRQGNVRMTERINDVLRRGLPSGVIRDYWLRTTPKDEAEQ